MDKTEIKGQTIVNGDCIEYMRTIQDGLFDAIVTDPPYNIGKAGWDKIPDYLNWCKMWIEEACRVCKPQGAVWVFHSEPLVLADIARMIEAQGRPMQNWITWDKYNETGTHSMKGFLDGYTVIGGLRRFQDFAEYAVYHANDGAWDKQSDQSRGFIFEPMRAYLAEEWKRAGLKANDANEACGTASMAGRHYFSRSQWCLPTEEHYASLRAYANAQGGGDYLRREYDDLRREYEYLRPTFHNPGKVASVWQFQPARPNGHPTPKPVDIMRRIIESTTNEGDAVLDPFGGSGTTLAACEETGRKGTAVDLSPKYCDMMRKRLRSIGDRLPGMTP